MKLQLHYDHVCGANPHWKRVLHTALGGHPAMLRQEFLLLSGFSPAGAQLLQACHVYAQCGQQVYYLGPRMQELLSATDLTKVPARFLGLPYPCFYVAFEDTPCRIWGGEHTRWHQVAGCYVIQQTEEALALVFWGRENERSVMVGDDATFWMVFKDSDILTTGEGDDRLYNLEQHIVDLVHDKKRDATDPGFGPMPQEVKDEQNQNILTLVRIIFNLLLYLNSSEPELATQPASKERGALKKRLKKIKNKTKRRKIQKRLDNLTEARIVWIGKSLEKEPKVVAKTGAEVSRAVRQHWRKGHWHPYWVGPRKDASGNPRKGDKQVLRWVQPTFVGRDMASFVRARGTVRRFEEDRV